MGVGANRGERPVYGTAFSTGLLDDIEVPEDSHSVAVDVEDATARSAGAGVPFSVVSFAEFQRDPVPAIRNRQGVGKMPNRSLAYSAMAGAIELLT